MAVKSEGKNINIPEDVNDILYNLRIEMGKQIINIETSFNQLAWYSQMKRLSELGLKRKKNKVMGQRNKYKNKQTED